MLTKQTIKEITGATIYHRGLELFRQNKVLSFQSEDRNEEIYVKATVQGSGRKKYKVTLAYDTLYEEITECYCDCPAFYSYDGLCKHCAAVLFVCEDRLEEHYAIFDYIEEPGQTIWSMKMDVFSPEPPLSRQRLLSKICSNVKEPKQPPPYYKAFLMKRLC